MCKWKCTIFSCRFGYGYCRRGHNVLYFSCISFKFHYFEMPPVFSCIMGKNAKNPLFLLFSCDQAALWMVFSVCLSVRLSVTPFWLCSHHCIIMKFLGVITTDQGNVHAKCQGQRSKVKVTEVATQLSRFRTVTPAWIHIWWWNDTYSFIFLRRGALLFFKVIRQVSRSHGAKNHWIWVIWPRLCVSGL